MARVSGRFPIAIAATLLLAGCASGGNVTDPRSDRPKLAEFEVPRPVEAVYLREVDMFRTCRVGPISKLFDLSIDPRFDRQAQSATLTIVATGYVKPEEWNQIEMQGHGDTTRVRIYGIDHPGLPHLRQDAEKWANGWNSC
ncbi:MAG TPA: hypothetical protein VGG48_12225 [Rhizomicrobium sp.]|jgi:endonuclease YncB( thermonuclease family)